MRRFALALALALFLAAPAAADEVVRDVVENHVLPGFARLEAATAALEAVAAEDCAAEASGLRGAYQAAFDAWMGVSHLRFGPTEAEMRGFALAFWPDRKGATPKTLHRLIEAEAPDLADPAAFAEVSVAARGFFALDALLYDEDFVRASPEARRCALVRAVAADAARTAAAIARDWRERHAPLMLGAGANDLYRSAEEARRVLLTALSTGLEFDADARLGLPMGTEGRPRPQRAEAWRSGRPLRNLRLSLVALGDLAARLAGTTQEAAPEAAGRIEVAFGRALSQAEGLDDPVFAGAATPLGRFRLESLQQAVRTARAEAVSALSPGLGAATGFNSMDGD